MVQACIRVGSARRLPTRGTTISYRHIGPSTINGSGSIDPAGHPLHRKKPRPAGNVPAEEPHPGVSAGRSAERSDRDAGKWPRRYPICPRRRKEIIREIHREVIGKTRDHFCDPGQNRALSSVPTEALPAFTKLLFPWSFFSKAW